MPERAGSSMKRRDALVALLTAGAAGMAGCTGAGDEGDGEPNPDDDGDGDPGPSDDGSDPSDDGSDPGDDGEDDEMPSPETVVAPPPERVTFITGEELEAIAAKIDAGEDPWRQSYNSFQLAVEEAMSADPRSVVDNGAPAGGSSPNQLGTDGPYQGTDGVSSDEANNEDSRAANDMSHWVRNTALAYAFTGEDEYAERAIDLLHHWCIDPETRMVPTTENFGPHTEGLDAQHEVAAYLYVPGMFYGASLVADHPYWDEAGGMGALEDWAADFLASAEERGPANGANTTSWRAATRIIFASFLDDQEALTRAYRFWTKGFLDLTEDGFLERELRRSRSLHYSIFALTPMAYGAEVARRRGTDLYEYSPAEFEGSPVRTIADNHVQYVLNESLWEHDQLDWGSSDERNAAKVYELLYSRWEDEGYLEVVEQAGRSVSGSRYLGNVTLTHGNSFDLGVDLDNDRRGLATELDAEIEREWVETGGSVAVTATVYNPSSVELSNVSLRVQAGNDEVSVDPNGTVDVGDLATETVETVEWEVTFPDDPGDYSVDMELTYEKDGENKSLSSAMECEVVPDDPVTTMTTTFDEYESGEFPSGWTPRWAASEGEWSISGASPGDADGQALRFSAGGNGRYALSWDEIPDPTRDVEVLAKVFVPQIVDRGNHGRIHVRGGVQGEDEVEKGYYFDLLEEGFSLWEYPSMVEFGRVGDTKSATWYWIRMRAVGPDLSVRYWEDGEDEPEEWQLEGSAAVHSGGWVGLGAFDSDPTYWGALSVATGGASAPMPADG